MNRQNIDVIIAVYNGGKYIREAVASVQAQSWKNVNIIVADDGSTDDTLSVVTGLSQSDQRIKVLSFPHRGVSATLNAAIRQSSASCIAFLDADDLWHDEKLEKQMQALAGSDVEICFSLLQEFESFVQGEPQTSSARKEPLKGYSKITFLGKRTLFETYGLFEEKVAIGDFVEWYSRVVRAGEPVIMLEEVLAFRRVHHDNTTRSAPKNEFLKLLKTHLDEKRRSTD